VCAIRRKLLARRFKRLKYLRGTISCRSKPVSRDGAMNFSRRDIVCTGLSRGVGRGILRLLCDRLGIHNRLLCRSQPRLSGSNQGLRFLSKVLRFGVNGFHRPRHIEYSPVGKTDGTYQRHLKSSPNFPIN
jgi:hypothetical protein